MKQLAHLGYQRGLPAPVLRPMVQCYWQIRREAGTVVPVSLMHPEGGSGLIFNFGEALFLDGRRLGPGGVVCGPTMHSTHLLVGGRVDAVGVRLRPGMGYAFFHQPLVELLGHVLDPREALPGFPAGELADTLREAPGLQERFALLDRALLGCLDRAPAGDGGLALALEWIARRQGRAPISQLAEELGAGQRQLERRFRHWLGLSPKQFSRLQRVAASRALVKAAPATPDLAGLALDAGYYDQAHFQREFRQVVGLTPLQYRARSGAN